MVQCLELHPFMAEDMGSIVSLVGELRSHKPHSVAKREKKTKGRGGGRGGSGRGPNWGKGPGFSLCAFAFPFPLGLSLSICAVGSPGALTHAQMGDGFQLLVGSCLADGSGELKREEKNVPKARGEQKVGSEESSAWRALGAPVGKEGKMSWEGKQVKY